MYDNLFNNFKQDPRYQVVLEMANYESGNRTLSVVSIMSPDLLRNEALLSTLRRSHEVGNPQLHCYHSDIYKAEFVGTWNLTEGKRMQRADGGKDFDEIGRAVTSEVVASKEGQKAEAMLSSSSIEYIRDVSTLQWLFGENTTFESVAEIGTGYGGLASFVIPLFNVSRFDVFDLPDPQKLTRRYLSHFPLCSKCEIKYPELLNSTRWRLLSTKPPTPIYDLCISITAFSELISEAADSYVLKVLRYCKRGLIMWNFWNPRYFAHIITLDEYLSKLSDAIAVPIHVLPLIPAAYNELTMIAWGTTSRRSTALLDGLLKLPRELRYPHWLFKRWEYLREI